MPLGIGVLILLLQLLPATSLMPQPAYQPYSNVDGNFAIASQNPYFTHAFGVEVHNAPWGNDSWNTSGFALSPNNGTHLPVDEYMVNVSSGFGHAWVREDRRLVDPRTGITGFGEDQTGGYEPPAIPFLGRDTILAYKIMSENTSISNDLNSPDYDGILFDIFAETQYTVNGKAYSSFFVIDFYVHQECGPLYSNCARTNDTTLTGNLANNHRISGHTHFFEWRIHSNLINKAWVYDVVNLRWYLEKSVQTAYCYDTTGSDICASTPAQAYLVGLTATAEAFGGTSGFALAYEYLLQANDCGIGQNAGRDFSHATRINNLASGAVLQVNGWLGSGSLYKDSDEYYRFNVTPNQISGGYGVDVQTQSGFPIQVYAPGDPPAPRASADGNSSLFIRYNLLANDPSGDWYLRVYGVNFGAYSLNISLYPPLNPPTQMPVVATCSPVSPAPLGSPTPWVLIGSLAVLTAAVILGGRYGSRRWKHLG